jgi:hypothetical protein
MKRAVQSAFGTAKLAGRDEMLPEDVRDNRGGRRSRIGF